MDDKLDFNGKAQKLTIETASITKGTFSDKEGKKEFCLEVNFNHNGDTESIIHPDKIENHVYHMDQLLCIHVANTDKSPIYKVDYFYEGNNLVKKTRTNSQGIVTEQESYHYNLEGKLSEKKSLTMTYEYIYENDLLVEERWHSEFSLNQIIKYSYLDGRLSETLFLSGDEIPGRKIVYKRDKNSFLTEEIVYSASNLVVSHFKYEYATIFKKNWLKRVKYSLTQSSRKDPIEVQYRDFKFYQESVKPKEVVTEHYETPEVMGPKGTYGEMLFENGVYKGTVLNDEMHGEGEFIFNTGTRYQGLFKNNSMEGRGKLTYINGKVYEGTFKNNVLEGPGACKWANGDFYAGEFRAGKMHGKGCYIWKNGNRFEGMFENNLRTEQGILYKESELASTAPPQWVNDLFK